MKKIAACSAAFFLFFGALIPSRAGAEEVASPPAIAAGAACLMDGETGQVLVGKELDLQLLLQGRYPGADGGLGQVQQLRRPGEAVMLRHTDEGLQLL